MNTWLEMGLSNALIATVLAMIVLVISRRLRPRWAYALWLLVLVKLLVPPLWQAPLGSIWSLLPLSEVIVLESPAETMVVYDVPRGHAAYIPIDEMTAHDARVPAASPIRPWFTAEWCVQVVCIGWGLGTVAWTVLAAVRIRRFRRLLSLARPAPAELQDEVSHLAEQLGLHRIPQVRLTRQRVSPLVWGFLGRPLVLLPIDLLSTLSPEQRSAILLHELVHVRRRDHLVKLLELAAVSLYWWLPSAWSARRRVEQAAELCCDADVVAQLPSATRPYAEALVATIDFLTDSREPVPLGASGFSQFGEVSRRIEMILEPNLSVRRTWPAGLVVLAVCLIVLPVSVESLWAQPAVPDIPQQETDRATDPNSEASTKSDGGGGTFTRHGKTKDWNTNETQEENAQKHHTDTVSASKAVQLHSLYRARLDQRINALQRTEVMDSDKLKSSVKKRDAVWRQLEAMYAAYDAHTVEIDQLLDAQQRSYEAELGHVGVMSDFCSSEDERRQLLCVATALIAEEHLNAARRTWQKVYSKYRMGAAGDEAIDEALAREQFFHFKQLHNQAWEEYSKERQRRLKRQAKENGGTDTAAPAGSDKSAATPYLNPILGPVTSGGKPKRLDPPSDDQLTRAVFRKLYQDGAPAPGKNLRIVLELVAEYVDPPRFYPLIGQAQQHHAHYKCTVYSTVKEGDRNIEARQVMYIDQNHLHLMPSKPDEKSSKQPPAPRNAPEQRIQNVGFFIGSRR